MHKWIRKCKKCNVYTLKEVCPCCNNKTQEVNPPNVGLEDPYQYYRVIKKLEEDGKWELLQRLK
ncbi:MAG: nucleolar RNA-binding Nop10p family protein [Nanoarchaeota archaeon]